MISGWTLLAALVFVLIGAVLGIIAALALVLRRDGNPYGAWLDRECEVLKGDGEWHRGTVVAVSHKGAVSVRNSGNDTGRHARWIPKEEVEGRVRWV